VIAAQSMTILAPQITALSNAAAAAAELFGIMNEPSELDPLDPSGQQPSTCQGEITVRDVDFVYPSRPSAPVLQDFSIDIPAGKTTALVGASGSGKSTMIGILERWYNPLKGSITLDGIELSDYNIKWLRSNIRLVQQVLPTEIFKF
jgi:ATP-binding cassette subfamily B (MDR/TAP) protein 1